MCVCVMEDGGREREREKVGREMECEVCDEWRSGGERTGCNG